jgi:SAM-dependent methyltransferase
MAQGMKMTHYPTVFNRLDETAAREIILTPEADLTTEERWEKETAFLTPYLDQLRVGVVVDYGCGIGRLSKVLAENRRTVIGVDSSSIMRQHAANYVQKDNFVAVSPLMLSLLQFGGLSARSAIAVWALQHIPALELEAAMFCLASMLIPESQFLVVNRRNRVIPCVDENMGGHWVNDGYDLDALLSKYFWIESEIDMPLDLCAPGAYLRQYRRKAII